MDTSEQEHSESKSDEATQRDDASVGEVEQDEVILEANTEEDLVGVTQVTYIQPDPEPEEDAENITLSVEAEEMNKEACTISNVPAKNDYVEEQHETDIGYSMEEKIHMKQEENFEDQDLDAIAEAVKATLAQQPGLNLSGELQMKVDQYPGKPTQVQVITEDGSVIVMELMTEEDNGVFFAVSL